MAAMDIFNDPGKGQAMVAPGLPASALSGSPAATLTNLAAIGGAQSGAALGGAISGAVGGFMGLPIADPAAMLQDRQQAFTALMDMEIQSGKALPGEAMLIAGQKAFKRGLLAPDEYLRLQGIAREQQQQDQALLGKSVEYVNKSDAVKDYTATKERFKSLLKVASDPTSNPNDFVLIQQGLKVLDPGSITSQNEINSAKMTAKGRMALQAAMGDDWGATLAGMMAFQEGKGDMLTLTENQKRKWLSAVARAVDGQREVATSVYLQGRDAYVGAGGVSSIYEKSLSHLRDLTTYDASLATADAPISPGTGSETWWGASERARANSADVGKKLGNLAADYGEIMLQMGVGGTGAAVESLWDSAKSLFGFGADSADASGAANTFAPGEYRALNAANIGTGSHILDQTIDITTGSHNAKAVGVPAIRGLSDAQRKAQKERAAKRKIYDFNRKPAR